VILHDAVYGHRYSRPRTSRASLSTIVERPERIKASVLGVSAAYVRLGERHAGASYPPHPHLDPGSIGSVPFRIRKTDRKMALSAQAVTNVHGTKWMEELKLMCDSAEAKLAQNGKELARPEMQREAGETPAKLHEGDLYLCAESLEALESALGGVCEAVDTVFDPLASAKRAFVAIRPPGHHCSASFPSGFCWLNNVHVGAMHGMLAHGMTHAAILDFDLHHGDGSQAIAWQHNSRSVTAGKNAAWWKRSHIGYFSLHDINSYPCEMGDEDKLRNASLCIDGAHGQSIWNVHLEGWKSDAEFWDLYEKKYSVLLEKMRGFLRAHTERLRAAGQVSRAAIFLSAGFDASEWEGAGMQRHNVNVPTDFYARVTRDVVRIAQEEGTSVDGRVISVLEGGYSDRALMSGIFSHLCGLAGDEASPTKETDFNGLGYEMGQRMGTLDKRAESTTTRRASNGPAYDPAWWSVKELECLEAAMAAPPPAPPKKPRSSMPPTYSSPTQASTAKVNATAPKVRRSMSGLSGLSQSQSNGASSPLRTRPPSPPPPEVPWATAVHELSKLLIPTGRQTGSCTAEDLSAEATRARRDRQSALAAQMQGVQVNDVAEAAQAQTPVSRMGLRERKAAKSIVPIHEEEDGKWGKNRRKTLGTERVCLLLNIFQDLP
jgi:histone deacetylase HOS3